MDSFKGCLSAGDACRAAMRGIMKSDPKNEVVLLPLADGGEGTADAITSALGGIVTECDVLGPFGDTERGYFGTVGKPDDKNAVAVIDTASASGIRLAEKHGLDPMHSSTYGRGRQIKDMLSLGYRKIIVGLGGSATNDGGTGALMALGARFYDKSGRLIETQGGKILGAIGKSDLSDLDLRLKETELRLLYDVAIPLTGEKGATINYSRQKGACDDMVAKLENGMKHYADVIRRTYNTYPDNIPGTGAAGGLGCGLMLAGGILTKGAPYMLKLTGFLRLAKKCDVIITGEGKTDCQTASGKLPVAVAREAKRHGKPVICICGTAEPTKEIYANGVDAVFSIADRPMSLEMSISEAARLIEKTCFNIANLLRRYE